MFGVGIGEMTLIAAVAIVVLGPRRCVELFRTAGRVWHRLRSEMESTKEGLGAEDLRDSFFENAASAETKRADRSSRFG